MNLFTALSTEKNENAIWDNLAGVLLNAQQSQQVPLSDVSLETIFPGFSESVRSGIFVLAIAARLGLLTVRLDEVLAEWARCGWWEDGGTFSGGFTDRAPGLLDVMTREPAAGKWLATAHARVDASAHTFDWVRP